MKCRYCDFEGTPHQVGTHRRYHHPEHQGEDKELRRLRQKRYAQTEKGKQTQRKKHLKWFQKKYGRLPRTPLSEEEKKQRKIGEF